MTLLLSSLWRNFRPSIWLEVCNSIIRHIQRNLPTLFWQCTLYSISHKYSSTVHVCKGIAECFCTLLMAQERKKSYFVTSGVLIMREMRQKKWYTYKRLQLPTNIVYEVCCYNVCRYNVCRYDVSSYHIYGFHVCYVVVPTSVFPRLQFPCLGLHVSRYHVLHSLFSGFDVCRFGVCQCVLYERKKTKIYWNPRHSINVVKTKFRPI